MTEGIVLTNEYVSTETNPEGAALQGFIRVGWGGGTRPPPENSHYYAFIYII